jgi:hypothetical protein
VGRGEHFGGAMVQWGWGWPIEGTSCARMGLFQIWDLLAP